MTVWYTADQHFGHVRIIELAQRPFKDVLEMDETLIQRWNERVQPDDTVWVLGDYALGHLDTSLGYTSRLQGHKKLMAGNHDRCFRGFARPGTKRTHAEWAQRYLDAGFDEVEWEENQIATIDEHLGMVYMSHFPYTGDSHTVDRFGDYRPDPSDRYIEDHDQPLLHGHVHTSWRSRAEPHPMVNVGVDVWDYAPVSGADIQRHRSGVRWP